MMFILYAFFDAVTRHSVIAYALLGMVLYCVPVDSGVRVVEKLCENTIYMVSGILYSKYVALDMKRSVYNGFRSSQWGLLNIYAIFALTFFVLFAMDATIKGGKLALSLLGVGAVVVGSRWVAGVYRSGRLLNFLGKHSMPIYLAHVISGSGVRILLERGLGVRSLVIHVIVGVLVGLAVPLFMYRVSMWARVPLFSLRAK